MWNLLGRFILRNRIVILFTIGLFTIFMGFMASRVKLSYDMVQMLPNHDSTMVIYNDFLKTYGQDGSVMFVGIKEDNLFKIKEFNAWQKLSEQIKQTDGVQNVLSLSNIYTLTKDTLNKKFEINPLISEHITSQNQLDSIVETIKNLPFYKNLIINPKSNATIMMVTIKKDVLNNKKRLKLISEIDNKISEFSKENNIDVHISGMPYIRTKTSKLVQEELMQFMGLSIIIAAFILFLFFRSMKAVIFPMIIVIISVIWALGTLAIFNYKVTILTGIIPPLLVIIGVENCIFLLNKYQQEYNHHRNKIKALVRVVIRTGNATFLTNATTAVGFATFSLTGNKLLSEFSIVAAINILLVFIFSVTLIPIIYSFLSVPNEKNLKHLENKNVNAIINSVVKVISTKRRMIYITTFSLTIIAIIGVTKLKTTGNVVDDIPHNGKLYTDLMFFEKEFNGILPFEIIIDTKKPRGAISMSTLKKMEQLQDTLSEYPEFSKPLSIVELVKYSKQAFYANDPDMYSLPDSQERGFILKYIPINSNKSYSLLNSFTDTSYSKTRISVQMANVSTKEIERIKNSLEPKINKIFPTNKYDVHVTGSSIVFLKGSDFLVKNLLTSLLFAIIIIGILLASLFSSVKMVFISLLPNILPLVFTAALMGFLSIPLKPSTVLVFSIALGISVDNAIHFLSRYRLSLKQTNWNINKSVFFALKETGFSMVYSSTVLFLGFGIFVFSDFGGTKAVGYLVSFTLLVALSANLIVLPSLLLTFKKRITTKRFEKPLVEIFDEKENID